MKRALRQLVGSCIAQLWRVLGWWWVTSWAHLSIASSRGTRPIGVRSGGASPQGPSGGQGGGGAFGSEGLVAAEHVPDRFGQPPREIDLGDLGAALLADPRLRVLVAVA